MQDHIYRVPVRASGQAGNSVDISLNEPLQGLDGTRAANGELFVAENKGDKISVISVNEHKASVTVIKDRLQASTGIEPAGDSLWITERKTGKVCSLPIPHIVCT